MQTPAITNLFTPGAKPAAAKQDEASPEMSFHRVLRREVAGRSPQQSPRQAANESDAAASAEASPPADDAAAASTVPDDDQAASVAEAARGKAGSDQEEVPAALDRASEELLALVANIQQAGAGAGVAAAGESGVSAAGDDKKKVAVASADSVADDDAALLSASDAAIAEAIATGRPATVAGTPTASPATVADRVAAEGTAEHKTVIEPSLKEEKDAAPAAAAATAAGKADDAADIGTSRSGFAAAMHAASGAATPAHETQQAAPAPAHAAQLQALSPQAPLQQAQAAAALAGDNRIAPRVGAPGWDQAVSQKVVWMVAGEQQSASLTLNPPDLGPLQVVLNVSNNEATVNFTAAQPEVRQALEASMPKLREMLGEAGVQLGQTSVSAGTPNHQQGGFEDRRPAFTAGGTVDNGADAPLRGEHAQHVSGGQGLVDTFA